MVVAVFEPSTVRAMVTLLAGARTPQRLYNARITRGDCRALVRLFGGSFPLQDHTIACAIHSKKGPVPDTSVAQNPFVADGQSVRLGRKSIVPRLLVCSRPGVALLVALLQLP